MIKFAVAGIAVTDETMAVDDIAKVGAFGDFLSLDATLKHMRELSQPEGPRPPRARGLGGRAGGTDLATRARARALELVESHQPMPLDPEVAEQVRGIIEAADRGERRRMKDPLKQAIIDGNANTALALTQALLPTGAKRP